MSASVEVPFIAIGNRRCLTAQQLVEDECLADFVARFPHQFEWDERLFVFRFIEPEEIA